MTSLELSDTDLQYVQSGLDMVLQWYRDVQSEGVDDWTAQITEVTALIRRVAGLSKPPNLT